MPGIERAAELLGRSITRAPGPYLAGIMVITIALGYAATGLKSEFSIRDILPRGGSLLADMETLDATVGGSTEITTVLVKAEATETRTLLNLNDLTEAFRDERTRPPAAAGPIQESYGLLVADWTEDSGEPRDKYDPELADLFDRASAGVELDPGLMQEFVDKLEATDPSVSRLLVNNPAGIDTMLLRFPSYTGDPARTKTLQGDLEALWFGNDESITATSGTVISITVVDAITDRQTEAITTTIAAALTVLAIFFWITVRQPALALIAVGPIVLVLIWVLGTMALLGIPYTIITSIITALSIGIGVDYTIHMIHRYREEYSHLRDPELAAVRTLSTTGSALLGSALTTALGLGVLVVSPLAASQQFGIHRGHHHRLLADGLHPGGAGGDDLLGSVPEHEAALVAAALGGRAGPGDRSSTPAPRTVGLRSEDAQALCPPNRCRRTRSYDRCAGQSTPPYTVRGHGTGAHC